MSAMREKDEADFDLERFINMFDTALTSDDERVKNALRQLMMMVVLTDDHKTINRPNGPLRRIISDVDNINRRLLQIERQTDYYNNRTAIEANKEAIDERLKASAYANLVISSDDLPKFNYVNVISKLTK